MPFLEEGLVLAWSCWGRLSHRTAVKTLQQRWSPEPTPAEEPFQQYFKDQM